MTDEISWPQVSSSFRNVFPETRPTDWKIIHMIFRNHLSKSGDVRRIVEICLESNVDGLDRYEWRIPLPMPQQNKVHGFSVRNATGELLKYDLKYYTKKGEINSENPDYALLSISIPVLNKGDTKTIRFEYYVERYARKVSMGLLSSLWQYSWSYRVHSETRKFEHRVVIPKNCTIVKNGFATNMPSPPINFSYGERETMIWMADNPSMGDFIGEVKYKQESQIGLTAVSLAGGALIATLTTLVTGTLSLIQTGLVFAIPIVGVFATVSLSRRLLPTQE